MTESATLLGYLYAYEPHDARESAHLEAMISFLQSCRDPFSRNTPTGHVTVSAVLVDRDVENVLLLWHRKLGRWLQPGGHCEPGADRSLVEAALRELEEETGVPPGQVELQGNGPFDIDVHEIPAGRTEAAHLHYDVRYLFRAARDCARDVAVNPEESGGYVWRSVVDLCGEEDASLSRFAKKIAARTAGGWSPGT